MRVIVIVLAEAPGNEHRQKLKDEGDRDDGEGYSVAPFATRPTLRRVGFVRASLELGL
jgi:hypothetical protein